MQSGATERKEGKKEEGKRRERESREGVIEGRK